MVNETRPDTYVGIDIGGTHTRIAIVDAHGRVVADRRTDTPTGDDGEALVCWLEDAYHVCRDEADSYAPPVAIGVGVPGVLEPGRSAVIRAVNLPYIEGLPLRDRLIERTGLITVLDCDTVAAAWGEYCVRATEPNAAPKRFGLLTLGTGVGAAVIVGGDIVRHTNHSVGHIGHTVCDSSDDAPMCACGRRGCVEAVLSAPALLRASGAADLNAIERALQEGDADAERFVNHAAGRLAAVLLDLGHLYAPDTLVVAGGVAAGLPSLVHVAAEAAKKDGGSLANDAMRVELSALGDYAGVVGAALLAKQHARDRAIE